MSSHFADDASQLPLDYLRGLAYISDEVSVDEQYRILHIAKPDRSKVALISGGGSGHEPAHAGFVGSGSLTAAVGGNIFASPNANQVRRALELVQNDKGTLVIVKQYTGDVLHFGMAGESALDNVEFLIVGDDVAVTRSQGKIVGRRGLAGTTLVYKVAGHVASLGGSLGECKRIAQVVAESVGTIGSSFAHCHVPGTKREKSFLSDGEMEIGTGIHNEPGVNKVATPKKAELVDQMVDLLTSTTDKERSFIPWQQGDEAVVMLNNLGGLSELELVGLVPNVLSALAKRGLKVVRLFVGTFMSSLDMPGFSITALRLPQGKDKETILAGVDAPSSAPGWRLPTVPTQSPKPTPPAAAKARPPPSGLRAGPEFAAALAQGCKNVIAAEPEITRYDTIAGDGDCGLTLKRGGEAVLAAVESGAINGDDVVGAVRQIAELVEEHMDGTSGALYAIYISALAKNLAAQADATASNPKGNGHLDPSNWADAARAALDVLKGYTSARPPSRTLMDPLVAFVDALPGLAAAADKAKTAAAATSKLVASAGRAAYVNQENLAKEDIPDPGAYGVALLVEGFATGAAKAAK